ncbi:hypothetical protein QBC46DRAFT_373719 [Diplogelasinospora grovesii]|uniref:Uncharacterized protein n=1 Tax=Diplogelasinospora grovesii TaxID=303347 RepID=A0AAN6NEZ0_9PEZI|nr:hypothetical protein QBC46DRAFT_373719 [Diplogelasinospora grovesii]
MLCSCDSSMQTMRERSLEPRAVSPDGRSPSLDLDCGPPQRIFLHGLRHRTVPCEGPFCKDLNPAVLHVCVMLQGRTSRSLRPVPALQSSIYEHCSGSTGLARVGQKGRWHACAIGLPSVRARIYPRSLCVSSERVTRSNVSSSFPHPRAWNCVLNASIQHISSVVRRSQNRRIRLSGCPPPLRWIMRRSTAGAGLIVHNEHNWASRRAETLVRGLDISMLPISFRI